MASNGNSDDSSIAHRDAAQSLGMLLHVLGAEVKVVFSGPETLQAIGDFRPAVVLLDIGMPGMNGHEVARKIREDRKFDNVSLIALTGWGQEDDRRQSEEAGFDHHLVKPADIGALETLLVSLDVPTEPRKPRCSGIPRRVSDVTSDSHLNCIHPKESHINIDFCVLGGHSAFQFKN